MTAMEAAAEKTKSVTIIVNTKPHEWAQKEISFEQVVELAFPGQPYTRKAPPSSTAAGTVPTSPCALERASGSRTE